LCFPLYTQEIKLVGRGPCSWWICECCSCRGWSKVSERMA
jgi:hypothetical protein